MKTINCDATLMPDGHLILPPDVIKKISVKKNTTHRILILSPDKPRKGLSRFCGKWKDDRDADDIIADIYADRAKNNRSDKRCVQFL